MDEQERIADELAILNRANEIINDIGLLKAAREKFTEEYGSTAIDISFSVIARASTDEDKQIQLGVLERHIRVIARWYAGQEKIAAIVRGDVHAARSTNGTPELVEGQHLPKLECLENLPAFLKRQAD